MAIFIRRENPPEQADYRNYKPYLRRDFGRRCAYCERTEAYLGGDEAFEVEHFKPKHKFTKLVNDYGNLYYACGPCNRHKSETWPSKAQRIEGFRFADPCKEDLYADHLSEGKDSTLTVLTPCGAYTKGHIRLDRDQLRQWRHLRNQAREDLPSWTALAQILESQLHASSTAMREELAQQLGAIRRRIEESKLRFSIG